MHEIVNPNQLKLRLGKVRLSPHALAPQARVHHTTIGRILAGSEAVQLDTLRRISDALIAEELALRDYLIGLHGLPAAGAGDRVSGVGEQEERAA